MSEQIIELGGPEYLTTTSTEEIMHEHRMYDYDGDNVPPTWGELLRDLGLYVCFHMVEVKND